MGNKGRQLENVVHENLNSFANRVRINLTAFKNKFFRKGFKFQSTFLLGTIAATIYTCLKFYSGRSPHKDEYITAALTLSSIVFTAQIFLLNTSHLLEQIKKSIIDLDESARDITVYDNSKAGLEYAVTALSSAEYVINTVLLSSTNAFKEDIYAKWINAKDEFLKDNTKTLKEIISSRFDAGELPYKFISEHRNENYLYKYIDDIHCPMTQIIIFYTKKNKEIKKEMIFGWELPNNADGPCFKTDNQQIVRYFEEYFNFYYNERERSQSLPTIIKQTFVRKCDIILQPGVWLYLLYENPDKELNSCYGTITIIDNGEDDINHKYQAEAKVWYYGKKERGYWHSTGFTPDPEKQSLHINYCITLENPTTEEIKNCVHRYMGYLHFEPEDQRDRMLIGKFTSPKGEIKPGKIMVTPYLDKNDSNKINQDIDDIEFEEAFRHTFKVNILDKTHVNKYIEIT